MPFSYINRMLSRIAAWLENIEPGHGALHQTQAVYLLTDEEMAKRGMKHREAARQIRINGDWR